MIVRLRSLRHYFNKPKTDAGAVWEDWTAPQGRVYVCLVLGTEATATADAPPGQGEPCDIEAVLKSWGWTPPLEQEAA
jgi:hypothetical protein